ncbi:unnamed protein product [Ilex paraguariensis]|uniref:Uncharacterized protein n=1 Tax=Ilex paraguariensis TaxID=185542 RepID=A0ABC8R3Q6_9AQUA
MRLSKYWENTNNLPQAVEVEVEMKMEVAAVAVAVEEETGVLPTEVEIKVTIVVVVEMLRGATAHLSPLMLGLSGNLFLGSCFISSLAFHLVEG